MIGHHMNNKNWSFTPDGPSNVRFCGIEATPLKNNFSWHNSVVDSSCMIQTEYAQGVDQLKFLFVFFDFSPRKNFVMIIVQICQ